MLTPLLSMIAQKNRLCRMFHNPKIFDDRLGKFHMWNNDDDNVLQNQNKTTPTPTVQIMVL